MKYILYLHDIKHLKISGHSVRGCKLGWLRKNNIEVKCKLAGKHKMRMKH